MIRPVISIPCPAAAGPLGPPTQMTNQRAEPPETDGHSIDSGLSAVILGWLIGRPPQALLRFAPIALGILVASCHPASFHPANTGSPPPALPEQPPNMPNAEEPAPSVSGTSSSGEKSLGLSATQKHPASSRRQTEPQCPLPRVRKTLQGHATYYSDKLAGNKMACGERYDPKDFIAAHRTLPFGTFVRVVRTPSGPSVTVRVTDRGPFGSRSRIIDLSRAAATKLQMLRDGVISVKVEVLDCGGK